MVAVDMLGVQVLGRCSGSSPPTFSYQMERTRGSRDCRTAGGAAAQRHSCKVPLPPTGSISHSGTAISWPKLLNVGASTARKVRDLARLAPTTTDHTTGPIGLNPAQPDRMPLHPRVRDGTSRMELAKIANHSPPPSPLPGNDAAGLALPPRPPTPDRPFERLRVDHRGLTCQRV
jgi:hypothetical protein